MAEMKQQGLDAPSYSMILVNVFQLLYVVDGLWNEVCCCRTHVYKSARGSVTFAPNHQRQFSWNASIKRNICHVKKKKLQILLHDEKKVAWTNCDCVLVFSGGDPDHHGLDARWFRLHVGIWWSGVGSLYVHSAGLLSGQPPHPPEPPCHRSYHYTQA